MTRVEEREDISRFLFSDLSIRNISKILNRSPNLIKESVFSSTELSLTLILILFILNTP